MAVITPNTDLYLLKVPLEIDSVNQLTFANKNAQYNYFNSLPKLEVEDYTYQRKDGTIRFEAQYDDVLTYNYVMYRNTEYNDKWFYAYIENMEYLNDNVTAIQIKTDVWQTWQFDLDYKPVFVEREHVNDDTIGKNTVDEGLEVGEYKIRDLRKIPISNNWAICFVATENPRPSLPFNPTYRNIGGVYTGMFIMAVKSYEDADTAIKCFNDAGKGEAIQNIFMIPNECVSDVSRDWLAVGGTPVTVYQVNQLGYDSSPNSSTIAFPQTLDNGYAPKNNKLFCYPYSYFYLDNGGGTQSMYKWEDFPLVQSNDKWLPRVTYKKTIIPSPSLSAKLYFTTYKGFISQTGSRAFSYGISFAKVPVCAWTTDYYTNWLTQNGVNMVTGSINNTIGNINNTIRTGAPATNIGIGLLTNVLSDVAQIHQAKTIPDQAHGDVNTGDFSYAYDKNGITCYMMCVREEIAKIIDNFFSEFGYKVNTVKIPNITGRRNWNYVKTIGCYIEADIPQGDLEEIKQLFNNGVTFWHNPATFADYSQNNDII